MKRIDALAFLIACVTFPGVAQSQTPAIPPHGCEKPPSSAGIDPNYERQQRFQKKVDAFKECINKYAQEMRKEADSHFELGKKYTESGNAAIDEYNAYVVELNKQRGQKSDDGSTSKPAVPSAGPKAGKY